MGTHTQFISLSFRLLHLLELGLFRFGFDLMRGEQGLIHLFVHLSPIPAFCFSVHRLRERSILRTRKQWSRLLQRKPLPRRSAGQFEVFRVLLVWILLLVHFGHSRQTCSVLLKYFLLVDRGWDQPPHWSTEFNLLQIFVQFYLSKISWLVTLTGIMREALEFFPGVLSCVVILKSFSSSISSHITASWIFSFESEI